ncbi:PhzF family phenazine biosynthesis protein [Methylomonas methanica]|uniref:Phenazine biosynthesis protein PhzF family n=1 Tax=Methylomonas methanica (strain DSM 25384 / MC09) TaxID=857087 RepID=G0A657_METMM|nr:PhzF family phenazine biosynthesis isomerase [Methylomonas methanica]AEG00507.1 phenazine biosynthesis protein PhzF family [Methylomonas methanica MC09]
MKTSLFIIDAFTDRAFSGNPAAVCLMDSNKDDAWMQSVAAEMNLSETAFLYPLDADLWSLRWFTPSVEVNLCGHATLAAAHLLRHELALAKGPMKFFTRSGILTATAVDAAICLDFPGFIAEPVELSADFDAAIGAQTTAALRAGDDLILVLPDAHTVASLNPDLSLVRGLTERGVAVTAAAPADSRWDFVSRFFAPVVGIAEDPVTGSAHCSLGPYWGKMLGKTQLTAYQASARGGEIGMELMGDRVRLLGQAKTVLKGELYA